MPKKLPQDKIDRARQLKAEGKSKPEIAIELGISLSSLDKYCGSKSVEEYNRRLSFGSPTISRDEYHLRKMGYTSKEKMVKDAFQKIKGLAKLVEEQDQ